MPRPWGAPRWRQAFLLTLTAAYGLALLAAFVLVPATDIPWIREVGPAWQPSGAWPYLLGTAWWMGRELRDILPWLAFPVIIWGLAGRLGAVDRGRPGVRGSEGGRGLSGTL